MNDLRWLASTGLCCALIVAGTAHAAAEDSASGAASSSRHEGLYVRISLGGGYASLSERIEGVEATEPNASGIVGLASIDVGGSVGEGLILHGRASSYILDSPSVTVGNESAELSGLTVRNQMLGLGLSWYSEQNAYLTGVVGTTRYTLKDSDESLDTEWGLGLEFDAGIEWWVRPDWALGIGARIGYGVATEQVIETELTGNFDVNFGGLMFALLASVSYD